MPSVEHWGNISSRAVFLTNETNRALESCQRRLDRIQWLGSFCACLKKPAFQVLFKEPGPSNALHCNSSNTCVMACTLPRILTSWQGTFFVDFPISMQLKCVREGQEPVEFTQRITMNVIIKDEINLEFGLAAGRAVKMDGP